MYNLFKRKHLLQDISFVLEAEKVRAPKTEHRFFNVDEIALAISACQTPRQLAMLYTFIDCPMRASELCQLKFSDVEYFKNEQGALKARVHVDGKTGKHNMRIDPEVAKMIQSLADNPDAYIFVSPDSPDKHILYHAVYDMIHRILIRAGFTGSRLSPHTLRHSSASLVMLLSKGNISLVDSLLAHAQGSSASKVYIHEYQESLAQDVSPLQMVKDQLKLNHPKAESQSTLMIGTGEEMKTDSTGLIISGNIKTTDNTPDKLINSMFPLPPEDTTIRSSFGYDEIMLVRRAFISLAQFSQVEGDGRKAQYLFTRMLRKVKTHQDSEPADFDTDINPDTYIIK